MADMTYSEWRSLDEKDRSILLGEMNFQLAGQSRPVWTLRGPGRIELRRLAGQTVTWFPFNTIGGEEFTGQTVSEKLVTLTVRSSRVLRFGRLARIPIIDAFNQLEGFSSSLVEYAEKLRLDFTEKIRAAELVEERQKLARQLEAQLMHQSTEWGEF